MPAWTSETVQDLVDIRAGESAVLEFKRELPTFSDKGKAEFLKDVSAMANESGGTIIYGIEEEDGEAVGFGAIDLDESDELIRRLAQIAQEGIEPQIRTLEIYKIDVGQQPVLVVEIPNSLDRPHRFKFNNHFRFVQRHDRHISDLTYGQLRQAFLISGERTSILNDQWRREFERSSYWRRVVREPFLLVRACPLASAELESLVDPRSVEEFWSNLMMSGWGGASKSYNYDGIAIHPGVTADQRLKAYVQVYRNGAISAWRGLKSYHSDENAFYGGWIVNFVREAIASQRTFFEKLGIAGPYYFRVGLMDVHGWKMLHQDRHGFHEEYETNESRIESPPIWLDSLKDLDPKSTSLLSQANDIVWQAFGNAECPRWLFDE